MSKGTSTTVGQIVLRLAVNIHDPLRINPSLLWVHVSFSRAGDVTSGMVSQPCIFFNRYKSPKILMTPWVFLSVSTRFTFVDLSGWIALKFFTHICVFIRLNCNNFDDPLNFHSSSIVIRSKFHFVCYFVLWANTCSANDIPVSLSCVCVYCLLAQFSLLIC